MEEGPGGPRIEVKRAPTQDENRRELDINFYP
jgi:hypothetical protein